MTHLSDATIAKLHYYVYLLCDPATHIPFYVGKGHGNRINQHLMGALDDRAQESEKLARIRSIQATGNVETVILRHGLSEKEAFEVESAVIDFIGLDRLTNLMAGHHTSDRGKMTLRNIRVEYEAPNAVFDEPAVLIRINRLFRYEMSPTELYEATRKHWKMRLRSNMPRLVCAVYRGIVREVYVADKWESSDLMSGRCMFRGTVAAEPLRSKYLDHSVSHLWNQGSQNPIKYVQ